MYVSITMFYLDLRRRFVLQMGPGFLQVILCVVK